MKKRSSFASYLSLNEVKGWLIKMSEQGFAIQTTIDKTTISVAVLPFRILSNTAFIGTVKLKQLDTLIFQIAVISDNAEKFLFSQMKERMPV